jgi:ornithine cyclodeaminase/alanine dehydrogenase-like protein (mu-crystallin family)
MPSAEPPPLLYLAAADVLLAMPDLDARLALAELTMTALAKGAELPSKIGIHPRPEGSFAHAMPAHFRGDDSRGRDDLVGMKWVAGFGTNNVLGLSAINALVVINDATTGFPTAVLDGGPITAQRTAAVSGVSIRRFAPAPGGARIQAALIGAGVQARSHLPVLARVLPGVRLSLFDRHPDRAEALAADARRMDGIGDVRVAADARSATAGADVVVTVASFGPVRQVMTGAWLEPDALVVPVDYATYCAADVAREAALFLVDHREQFLATRAAGLFEDYPEPSATIGEAILAGTPRPPRGRVVVTHLGVGLADVVFGAAILDRARELGLGIELPR